MKFICNKHPCSYFVRGKGVFISTLFSALFWVGEPQAGTAANPQWFTSATPGFTGPLSLPREITPNSALVILKYLQSEPAVDGASPEVLSALRDDLEKMQRDRNFSPDYLGVVGPILASFPAEDLISKTGGLDFKDSNPDPNKLGVAIRESTHKLLAHEDALAAIIRDSNSTLEQKRAAYAGVAQLESLYLPFVAYDHERIYKLGTLIGDALKAIKIELDDYAQMAKGMMVASLKRLQDNLQQDTDAAPFQIIPGRSLAPADARSEQREMRRLVDQLIRIDGKKRESGVVSNFLPHASKREREKDIHSRMIELINEFRLDPRLQAIAVLGLGNRICTSPSSWESLETMTAIAEQSLFLQVRGTAIDVMLADLHRNQYAPLDPIDGNISILNNIADIAIGSGDLKLQNKTLEKLLAFSAVQNLNYRKALEPVIQRVKDAAETPRHPEPPKPKLE